MGEDGNSLSSSEAQRAFWGEEFELRSSSRSLEKVKVERKTWTRKGRVKYIYRSCWWRRDKRWGGISWWGCQAVSFPMWWRNKLCVCCWGPRYKSFLILDNFCHHPWPCRCFTETSLHCANTTTCIPELLWNFLWLAISCPCGLAVVTSEHCLPQGSHQIQCDGN